MGEAQERRETEKKKKDKSQTRKKKKKNKPAKAKVFTFKMPPNFSKSELEELKSDIVRPKVPFVVNGRPHSPTVLTTDNKSHSEISAKDIIRRIKDKLNKTKHKKNPLSKKDNRTTTTCMQQPNTTLTTTHIHSNLYL